MNIEKHNKENKWFYSGTSGLMIPLPNKKAYPQAFQDKSRLTYYASLFNSIEINSSFKKVPMAKTVEKWGLSVPDDFQFTFKLPANVTHNKLLEFEPESVHNFFKVIAFVGKKKGCLLVQFPGKLTIDYSGQLEKLLNVIQLNNSDGQWKVAIEFRNTSWYHDDIYNLLQHHRAAMVLHDMPAAIPPFKDDLSGFVYVRLHGPEKGYRGSYSSEFLNSYAKHIARWKNEGKEVYIYFNNTLGDAVNNLITLNGMMGH